MSLPSNDGDQGFTIVELLIAISVMLVIVVPLAGSFVLGLGTANGSLQDTTNSADAQIVAGFFDTDVTNAESVALTSTCGSTGTAKLGLSWADGSQAVAVAYRLIVNDTAAQSELATPLVIDRLERVRCVDGVVVDTSVIARSVLDSSGVQISCDATPGSCPTPRPRRVSLSLTEFAPQLADTTGGSRYAINVTATRKVVP